MAEIEELTLEQKVMKATGLTKNVVCKMLADAQDMDEVGKAKVLSHIMWHMPNGVLAQTDSAKEAKVALVTELAEEIGTEVPEDLLGEIQITVKDDETTTPAPTEAPTTAAPVETTTTTPTSIPVVEDTTDTVQ